MSAVATFRPTRSQLRRLVVFAVGLSLVPAAIVVAESVSRRGPAYPLAMAAAIGAALAGWVPYRYARAFTECSPAGIRSRGVTGEWRCNWRYVADIGIQTNISRGPTTCTVILTAIDGGTLRLGMPVSGGIMPDPDFDGKVAQIRAYWRQVSGPDPQRASQPTPGARGDPRTPIRALARGAVELILVGAIVAVPFSVRSEGPALLARLGQGQPGYLTVTANACDQRCYWLGDFRARRPAAIRFAVPIAPGARIAGPGDRVPAVYMGDGNLVYPAGGGPDWIPLSVLLLVIGGCLPLVTWWYLRARNWRRGSALAYQPRGAAGPARLAVTDAWVGVLIVVYILVLTSAGASISYWAQDVPVDFSPSALACADYLAWEQAQPLPGGTDVRSGLLAGAVRDATGQLRVALSTLQAAASSEPRGGPGSTSASASAALLGDMTAAAKDCT
jgi:hypothetical protein